MSLDGNFWYGGKTSLNGVENPKTLQKNSRVGLTLAVPIGRQHSVKIAYSRGAMTTIVADFDAIGVSYQYIWGSKR